jgi:hypothetical protein
MSENRKSIKNFSPDQIDTGKVLGGKNVLAHQKSVDEAENIKAVGGRIQPKQRMSERTSE